MPLSPNRVQVGNSQDVPDEESLFNVSPVTQGFFMRPSGATVQQPEAWVAVTAGLLVTLYSEIQLLMHNAL